MSFKYGLMIQKTTTYQNPIHKLEKPIAKQANLKIFLMEM